MSSKSIVVAEAVYMAFLKLEKLVHIGQNVLLVAQLPVDGKQGIAYRLTSTWR